MKILRRKSAIAVATGFSIRLANANLQSVSDIVLPRNVEDGKVFKLELQGNELIDLSGLERFPNLESINLENNRLENLDECILVLLGHKHLMRLALRSNPMCWNEPNFRAFVVVNLPGLSNLDGVKVTEGERRLAHRSVSLSQTSIDMLVESQIKINALRRASQLNNVHLELMSLVVRIPAFADNDDLDYLGEPANSLGANDLLRIVRIPSSRVSADLEVLRGQVIQECLRCTQAVHKMLWNARRCSNWDGETLVKKSSGAWSEAFREVLGRKQIILAKLIAGVDSYADEKNARYLETCSSVLGIQGGYLQKIIKRQQNTSNKGEREKLVRDLQFTLNQLLRQKGNTPNRVPKPKHPPKSSSPISSSKSRQMIFDSEIMLVRKSPRKV